MGSDRTQSLWGVAELEETLELYRSIVRASPDAVTATDLEGRITAISQRTVELHGGSGEAELLGQSALEFIDPDEHERALANLALTLERGVIGPVEYKMRRRDGSCFSGELCAATVYRHDGTPTGFVATVRDITEKKLARAKLEESEARYRILVELSPDPVVILQNDGYRFVNAAFTRLFGYTQDDLKAGLSFMDLVPEHERAGVQKRYAARLAGETLPLTYLLDLQAKDGRLIPCETSARLIQFEGVPADLVIIRNVTERVLAAEHQRRLDARIQQTQKLESLGLLAGGVAHDFNNLLMGILGNVGLLRAEVASTAACTDGLDTIETAALRASDLCQQLLAYAGRQAPKTEPVDLGVLLTETAKLLSAALPPHVRLVERLAPGLPLVIADATQVRQAIMNLITNGADAIGDNPGVVTIRTGITDCDVDYLAEHAADTEARPGSYAFVEVSDTGKGMDAATIERIFEPFFTTKAAGRGLGLASVRGCLRAHHGAFEVHGVPGEGSTFRLLFPTSEATAQAAAAASDEAPEAADLGTVLVIDDEPLVRNVIAAVLRSAGYDVVTASDGAEALAQFRGHQPSVVALVVDVRMPFMSGEDVVRAIREISPDVPVLFTSGHHDQDSSSLLGQSSVTRFIPKPFSSELLLSSMSDLLERRPQTAGAA